jgi:putative endonuclease
MENVVYILESQSNGRLYIGCTNDLNRRLEEHNANHTRSTRNKGPWELVHFKRVGSKAEALELEKKLKSWKSRKRVLSWIERDKTE